MVWPSGARRQRGVRVVRQLLFETDQWLWRAKVSENFGARNTCRSARLRQPERFRAAVAVT